MKTKTNSYIKILSICLMFAGGVNSFAADASVIPDSAGFVPVPTSVSTRDIADKITTRTGRDSVSCLANEKLISGLCRGTDHCGGNDWSGHGGYFTGNRLVCGTWYCNTTYAYVQCMQI